MQVDAYSFPSDQDWFVYNQDSASDPFNSVDLEIYGSLGGPTGTFKQTLTGENYETCGLCVLAVRDCTSADGCDKIFLGTEGEVDVTALDLSDGGALKATMTDLKLIEVTIDPDTYKSTPVTGGDVWCVDNWAVDTTFIDGEGG